MHPRRARRCSRRPKRSALQHNVLQTHNRDRRCTPRDRFQHDKRARMRNQYQAHNPSVARLHMHTPHPNTGSHPRPSIDLRHIRQHTRCGTDRRNRPSAQDSLQVHTPIPWKADTRRTHCRQPSRWIQRSSRASVGIRCDKPPTDTPVACRTDLIDRTTRKAPSVTRHIHRAQCMRPRSASASRQALHGDRWLVCRAERLREP